MTVHVVTDSASNLRPDVVGSDGIVVVPMSLTIGGRALRENDVSVEEVLTRFDEGVTTAGPAPGDFLAAYEAVGDGGDILVLTVAERLSSTAAAARLAAGATTRRVRVVSTGTAAGAEGLVVLHAARAAAAGRSLDDVEAAARHVMSRVHLVAALDTLAYLVKGGRVPSIAGWAGQRLGLRPIVELRSGGRIVPVRPALGRDASLDHILRRWRKTKLADHRLHVCALHAMAELDARRLMDEVCREVEPASAFVAPFTTIMAAHTGPGLCGLAWWWEQS